MKTLHLLRHAKSDWSDNSLADHDRPLNKRGKHARLAVAEHVRGWPVDLVVCSTATRARQTAKPVVAALGCPVRYDDALYETSGRGLLDVVRALDDGDDAVMLVGHNPSIEDLTRALCGDTPVYATAALGTVGLDVERWADVAEGVADLTAFDTPRGRSV